MENEPHNTSVASNHIDRDPNPEPLIESLGIEFDPEVERIAGNIKNALNDPDTDPETLRLLWIEFSRYFETIANAAEQSDEYAMVQISAMLHEALIFRDTNQMPRYLEELDLADMYSYDSGYTGLSLRISDEIDSRVPDLDEVPERLILQLRGKISDDNRARLWDLWAEEQDYENLINHASAMLLDNSEDPREVLGELGLLDS